MLTPLGGSNINRFERFTKNKPPVLPAVFDYVFLFVMCIFV
jgi:hypothetical protein